MYLHLLKSGFKRTINWNRYQSKTTTQNAPNQYLHYLIKSIFQGVNRLFVLAYNAGNGRILHSRNYLATAKLEDYNVMIDEKNIFDQSTKNHQYKMTQYNTSKVKLSNSQLNKLKSGIKSGTAVPSNVVGDSNDENNFPHKLLLANTQVSKLRKAFSNNSSANKKLSETQLYRIGQSGGFVK